MATDPFSLPIYARPPGSGPTPKGLVWADNPYGMAKGLAKVAGVSKTMSKAVPRTIVKGPKAKGRAKARPAKSRNKVHWL